MTFRVSETRWPLWADRPILTFDGLVIAGLDVTNFRMKLPAFVLVKVKDFWLEKSQGEPVFSDSYLVK